MDKVEPQGGAVDVVEQVEWSNRWTRWSDYFPQGTERRGGSGGLERKKDGVKRMRRGRSGGASQEWSDQEQDTRGAGEEWGEREQTHKEKSRGSKGSEKKTQKELAEPVAGARRTRRTRSSRTHGQGRGNETHKELADPLASVRRSLRVGLVAGGHRRVERAHLKDPRRTLCHRGSAAAAGWRRTGRPKTHGLKLATNSIQARGRCSTGGGRGRGRGRGRRGDRYRSVLQGKQPLLTG